MQPKVSIIVPNYNHFQFLEKRLVTIFNQTYQNFEVILLDDASTDDSIQILQKYAGHPKVSCFVKNKTNSGSPFKQWKKGIELAKGKYIWIAESDDFSSLNFLEKLIKYTNHNYKIIYCASNIINQENEILHVDNWASRMDPKKWNSSYSENGCIEIKNYLRFRNTIPNASAVIFKNDLDINLETASKMKYCGDWFIWLEILKTGKIFYLNEPLNFFRKHPFSTRSIKEEREEKERFQEYFLLIRRTSNLIDRIRNHKKYSWIFNELKGKSKYLNKQFILKVRPPFPLTFYYMTLFK